MPRVSAGRRDPARARRCRASASANSPRRKKAARGSSATQFGLPRPALSIRRSPRCLASSTSRFLSSNGLRPSQRRSSFSPSRSPQAPDAVTTVASCTAPCRPSDPIIRAAMLTLVKPAGRPPRYAARNARRSARQDPARRGDRASNETSTDMDDWRKEGAFGGRLVMVGFGCIGQGMLPLLLRHIDMQPARCSIVSRRSRRDWRARDTASTSMQHRADAGQLPHGARAAGRRGRLPAQPLGRRAAAGADRVLPGAAARSTSTPASSPGPAATPTPRCRPPRARTTRCARRRSRCGARRATARPRC